MNEGRIEQLGAPLELYDRPANLFVAQFIGSPAMNVVEGVFRRSQGSSFVKALGHSWPVSASSAADGQAVKYGIRPEHIHIGSEGIAAEVVVVEPMGAEAELIVKVGDTPFTVKTHGRSSAKPGERISLQPDAYNAHVFDAATGRRI
jgi:multiple sugar transport system ATP-binding protein